MHLEKKLFESFQDTNEIIAFHNTEQINSVIVRQLSKILIFVHISLVNFSFLIIPDKRDCRRSPDGENKRIV